MMQKIMKCGLFGGLILFIWSAAAWTVLPWQKSQMKTFTNEKSVRFAIKDYAPVSGLYCLPNLNTNDPDQLAAAQDQMREGPYMFAAVMVNGKSPEMLGSVIQSLIVKIILASLVAWLLMATKLDYNKTVAFVTVLGFVTALAATLPYAIWFGFPGTFVISSIIEITFGWFFAGLAMARFTSK